MMKGKQLEHSRSNAASAPGMSARYQAELARMQKYHAKIFQRRTQMNQKGKGKALKCEISAPYDEFAEETPESKSPGSVQVGGFLPIVKLSLPSKTSSPQTAKRCNLRSAVTRSKKKSNTSTTAKSTQVSNREDTSSPIAVEQGHGGIRRRHWGRNKENNRSSSNHKSASKRDRSSLHLRYPTAEEKEQALNWRSKLQSKLGRMTWEQVPLDFFIDETVEETMSPVVTAVATERHRQISSTAIPISANHPRNSNRARTIADEDHESMCSVVFQQLSDFLF
jgi:hypothetical protein